MNAQDLSNEILTDIELERVITFAEDPILFQAVKKYVLAIAYKHGVVEKGKDHVGNLNYALNMAWGAISSKGMPRSDEELGQNIRALAQAVQLIEGGFKELSDMKDLKEPKPITNKKENPSE